MKIVFLIVGFLIGFKMFFLILEQKGLYHPTAEIAETPASLGIPFEDVRFMTQDNQKINGWFVPAHGAQWTVLYCHGNAGNISHRLHKVRFFHELGVNFFIFDYRGFGKSTGRPSERGLYKDAQAAYDYLVRQKGIAPEDIAVYGKSLGGPVAAELATSRKTGALILEGSFASVTLRAQQLYPFLPVKLLVSQRFDTVRKVRSITVPTLIVHGRQDDVISFNHGELVYAASAGPKEFIAFDGSHNDDIYVISPQYRDRLHKFLRDVHPRSNPLGD